MENQENKSKAKPKLKESAQLTEKGASKAAPTTTAKNKKEPRKKKKRTPLQMVLFFLLKWTLILLLLFFSVAIGLVVGFSILGDGTAADVFDMETWRHIYNLVFNV